MINIDGARLEIVLLNSFSNVAGGAGVLSLQRTGTE